MDDGRRGRSGCGLLLGAQLRFRLGLRLRLFLCADASTLRFPPFGFGLLVRVDARRDRQLEVVERLGGKLLQVGQQRAVLGGVGIHPTQLRAQVGGLLAGGDLGVRQRGIELVLNARQGLQALDGAREVRDGRLQAHAADFALQAGDVRGKCLAGRLHLLRAPALLLAGQQLLGHQAVVSHQLGEHVLLALGFIDALDLRQHHGFGGVQRLFRLLHGLDLQVEVGEVLVGLRVTDELVVEEVAQRRLEHLEVVAHVDLAADLNGHRRQCLNGLGDHRWFGVRQHVVGQVAVELRPACLDADEPGGVG